MQINCDRVQNTKGKIFEHYLTPFKRDTILPNVLFTVLYLQILRKKLLSTPLKQISLN